MKEADTINSFPKTHIKPYDGMSITADVWARAHEEHRQAGRAHDLIFHGSGILTGLNVVANDPADRFVFISPGVAVDSGGNVIVLSEPVAYDFGSAADGTLFLLLGHGEREVGGVDKDVKYLQDEFVVAARSSVPKRPAVELARVTITKASKTIKNAADPAHPGQGELDLRYRMAIGVEPKKPVLVAICNFGPEVAGAVSGWDYLSREAARYTPHQLIIDQGVSITDDLKNYDIVYLTGCGAFKSEDNKIKALKSYLDGGRTLVVESFDDASEAACKSLLEKLDLKPGSISSENELLTSPFLFNAPPAGNHGREIMIGKQIIYSTARYSLAWSGQFEGEKSTRADVRSAHEWGLNMVLACLQQPRK